MSSGGGGFAGPLRSHSMSLSNPSYALSTIGEQLRKMIRDRTRAALEGRAAKGSSAGRRAYGYDNVLMEGGRKWYVVNRDQARHVPRIFERIGRKTRREDGKWLQS